MEDKIYRIIDANINRAKEGIRVVEDVCRFVLEDEELTSKLKKIRHQIGKLTHKLVNYSSLLTSRDSECDPGLSISAQNKGKRKDYVDLVISNMCRAEESCRVLEEISKLKDENLSFEFEKIRYALYLLEKEVVKIIERSVCNC
ncbi:MAG: thiamine-phosphate pyrophosphorylase [bacterium]